jgi:DNA mismatch endonuclease (patch repair protein)
VFRRQRVVVFVDGDFWNGWRFPLWRLKLSEKWEAKIDGNRRRDARNRAKLCRQGWIVVRIWEHEMDRHPGACLQKVLDAVTRQPGGDRSDQVGSETSAARRGIAALCR